VEVQLNTILWQDAKSNEVVKNPDPKALADTTPSLGNGTLSFNQAYTFSNFYYNNDPVFKHNALPGLPVHYYYGELRYDHPSGFYVGFNTKIASGYTLDYANTVYTKAYEVFGTELGYESKKGFSVFLDFDNLTNEHYAADVSSPAYDVHGSTTSAGGAVLDPGDGFAVNSGVTYKF
jgi:iron complex outermembrane receptor protein